MGKRYKYKVRGKGSELGQRERNMLYDEKKQEEENREVTPF